MGRVHRDDLEANAEHHQRSEGTQRPGTMGIEVPALDEAKQAKDEWKHQKTQKGDMRVMHPATSQKYD